MGRSGIQGCVASGICHALGFGLVVEDGGQADLMNLFWAMSGAACVQGML